MSWERATDTEDLVEWERDDGAATVRLRAHPDGAWVVRLDRMYQAPEGGTYRRERAETRAAGFDLAEAWREEFDSSEE